MKCLKIPAQGWLAMETATALAGRKSLGGSDVFEELQSSPFCLAWGGQQPPSPWDFCLPAQLDLETQGWN